MGLIFPGCDVDYKYCENGSYEGSYWSLDRDGSHSAGKLIEPKVQF